jgi:ribosome maturation factor RimP
MASNKDSVAAKVEKIAQPIARQLGLELWDVEFVKEGASWFLRIFIDKEGGIGLADCENFSHAIDGPLDEADPIEQHYYLEVSSPGIERELKHGRHFESVMGQSIRIKLIRPADDGARELIGRLIGFQGGVITIDNGEGLISVKQSDTAFARIYDTEDFV